MKLLKNNHGMSLVETMMAILLFGIVLVGLLEVCAKSMLMAKRSDFSYKAYNLAKNRLETLKTISFGNLSASAETDTVLDADGVPDTDGIFKRNTTVSTSYNGDTHLTSVLVTVDYKINNSFVNKPITLQTVIFEYA